MMTLGSLFSGSGSFEQAGAQNGIVPAFASEVEPYAIAVTTSRFPKMKHLGNVTEIKGGDMPSADVITFGSPCFPAGTLILTNRGYVPIEEVVIGDQVLTHLGRWKPVTKIGHKEWNTVVLKGNHYGQEITPEHPIWSAETRNFYPRLSNGKRGNQRLLKNVGGWTPAKDMLGKRWAIPTYVEPVTIPFPNAEMVPVLDEKLMYFIGMWLGDGWLDKSNNQICLCAAGQKTDRARNAIHAVFSDRFHYNEQRCRTVTRFVISCRSLGSWIRLNFDSGAANKTIPTWVYGMNSSLRKALFDGYMATDGSKQREYAWRTTTVSKKLAHGIRLLAQTLGYATAIFKIPVAPKTVIEGRLVNQRTQYQVQFTNSWRRNSLETETHSWNTVKSILPGNPRETVYNITVADDHSYLVEGVVVHNCQDISVAGKQVGLHEGKRSSLFFEAIRIIREMRCATHGQYPKYAVFENVPGLFSSAKGADFRAVLQAFIGLCDDTVSVPEPPKGRWIHAGEIVGDHFSLAWRVQGAEYWGVPQRRNRIYLVVDFTGERAGKVLFEQESLRGDLAAGETPGQGIAADAAGCVDGGCKQRGFLTPWDCQSNRVFDANGVFPTLPASSNGGQNNQAVMLPAVCNESGIGYWMPGFGCLRAEGENRPSRPGHLVCFAQNQRDEVRDLGEHTGSLAANPGMKQQSFLTYALQANGIDRADTAGCNGCGWKPNVCYTLNTVDRHGVCYQDVVGALCAADWRGPNSQYVGADKIIIDPVCTDARGNGDGKTCSTVTGDHESRVTDYTNIVTYGGDKAGTLDASYYKGAGERNGKEREFIAEAKPNRKYVVRRLSTTECARLQGLPDCWAHPVHKETMTDDEVIFWEGVRETYATINGTKYRPFAKREQLVRWYNRLHTDSAEYKLYGNGIALPCAVFVLHGIAEELRKDELQHAD